MSQWFLEFYPKAGRTRHKIQINHFPFTVGRQIGLPLTLHSPDVSRHHAEFNMAGRELMLCDLGSTNGTFVNHMRISAPQCIRHGDIVHFANFEYRVVHEMPAADFDSDATHIGIAELSHQIPQGLQLLQELLARALTSAEFQPIMHCRDETVFGYEILGRGTHPGLPVKPQELLRIAESADLEIDLSEMFRDRGVEMAVGNDMAGMVFLVNTHPSELKKPDRLVQSIRQLRGRHPDVRLIVEIHEAAVTDLDTMCEVKNRLQEMNVGLAYDDFGAGQARFLELVEASPEILKFDISLVRGIDKTSSALQHMVKSLVQLSKDSRVRPLAEGVTTAEEIEVCRALGFDLLQGYYYPFLS